MRRARNLSFKLVLAAAVGGGLLALGLNLRLPDAPEKKGPARATQFMVATAENQVGAAMRERLWLMDPSPLFLPSALSYTRLGHAEGEKGVLEEAFGPFPAQFAVADWFKEQGRLMPVSRIDYDPVRSLSPSRVRFPFLGLGRASLALQPMEGRWAVADVYEIASGDLLRRVVLPSPKQDEIVGLLWAPMELILATAPDGLVGKIEMNRRSGNTEIDDYVIDVVSSLFSMSHGLPPGIYRLEVGS